MNFIFHFLLISSFLITINESAPSALRDYVEKLVRRGTSENIIRSRSNSLILVRRGFLGESNRGFAWKGLFNNEPVAVKITIESGSMENEMEVYNALNAQDPNIESLRIPRIYYSGTVLGEHSGIAMTLFPGTLNDRFLAYTRQNRQISNFSILMILKQAVEVLEYIHKRNVLHNDIKPANIFLRGREVFIGDFDMSTTNNHQNNEFTAKFASSNAHTGQARGAMDDIQSLVFSMWHVAGMPPDDSGDHEGYILAQSIWMGNAQSKMMEKCEYFGDENVKKAFQYICVNQILSRSQVPEYKKIRKELEKAIAKVSRRTGQTEFEWLAEESGGESSGVSNMFSNLSIR